jgi:hypothetical protein
MLDVYTLDYGTTLNMIADGVRLSEYPAQTVSARGILFDDHYAIILEGTPDRESRMHIIWHELLHLHLWRIFGYNPVPAIDPECGHRDIPGTPEAIVDEYARARCKPPGSFFNLDQMLEMLEDNSIAEKLLEKLHTEFMRHDMPRLIYRARELMATHPIDTERARSLADRCRIEAQFITGSKHRPFSFTLYNSCGGGTMVAGPGWWRYTSYIAREFWRALVHDHLSELDSMFTKVYDGSYHPVFLEHALPLRDAPPVDFWELFGPLLKPRRKWVDQLSYAEKKGIVQP